MPDPSLRSGSPRVAVIGGGPAGLMAAEVLARSGAHVTVFERMPSVGRKLLVAGRGGLNLTHTEPLDDLLDRYGPARPILAPAIEAFGPDDLRVWCEGLGQAPFVGSSGRVFPSGFRATPLLRSWLARLDELGVEVQVRHSWRGWADDGVLVADAEGIERVEPADAVVLALGGASWPRTGSDGGWVEVVRADGIEVTPLRPANVGIEVAWTPMFADRFAGTPLKNVRLSVGGAANDLATARGDAMVTTVGLEGGVVYAVGRELDAALGPAGASGEVAPGSDRTSGDVMSESTPSVGDAALERDGESPRTAEVVLRVDLLPDLTADEVAARLGRRRPKDSTSNALRRALGLSPVAIGLLREVTGNDIPASAEELAALVKAAPLIVTGQRPLARAISTAGGIALGEVDESLMLRRRPGTFLAGEMLDWTAPTGGYLLQATLSTAVAAARGAIRWITEP